MKLYRFLVFLGLLILSMDANASDEAVILQEGISSISTYKGGVVSESNGNFTIDFPQTKTLKQVLNSDDKVVNISGVIPAYKAQAVKSGDFIGKDMYKISTTATEALLSYFYQKYKVTDASVADFSSEIYFVPDLRFMKYIDARASGIVFNSKDPNTGLKSEIGSVKQAQLRSSVKVQDGKILYQAAANIKDMAFSLWLVDVMISELESKISATYADAPDVDYSKFPENVASMQKSNSIIEAKNAEFSILGIGVNASLGMVNNAEISEDKMRMSMDGKFVLSDVKVGQDINNNIPQEVVVKYELGNIDKDKVNNLQELQMKLNSSKNNNDGKEDILKGECLKAVEQVIKDMKLVVKARVKYENALVELLGNFGQQGDYLVGDGKILVKNFDLLYPDLSEECERDKQSSSDTLPDSCIKNMTSAAFRKYVDMNKRTKNAAGETVDILEFRVNSGGVYVGGEKVRDAIKIKFDEENLAEQ